MARILHISCDFPDVFVANKTQAIKRLIDGTPDHDHTVYSLNRVDGLSGMELVAFGESRFAIAYRAPPKGLLLRTRLLAVAKFILSDIHKIGLSFDLIHAHKLTIEGIVGHHIAAALGIPIAFSVQGDTDFKVMEARPDLTRVFRRHVNDATQLFCFAPWSRQKLEEKFPQISHKTVILPVVPGQDELSSAPVTHTNRLISVFHLDNWRRKNLSGMAKAVRLLSRQIAGIHLDIIGGGSPRAFIEARQAVHVANADHLVTFKGPVANGTISGIMKNYAAFILPTLRESYGLVHAEAMFAGLPVLVSKDMGIDGLIPTCNFIETCDPRSMQSIAKAIQQLLHDEAGAKLSVAQAQQSGLLNGIRRNAIVEIYGNGLRQSLELPMQPAFQLQAAQ